MKNNGLPSAEQNAPKQAKTEKKSVFSFLKKNKKTQPQAEVRRFNADANEGLSTKQVEERVAQGLVNKTAKK